MESLDFSAQVRRTFAWLIDDGFTIVEEAPNDVRFARPPLSVNVVRDAHTTEVGVNVRRGNIFVGLKALRRFRGDLQSYVGKTGPEGDFHWDPTVRTSEEASSVLGTLSEQLRSFRETALDPNSIVLLQAADLARRDTEAWLAEPRWIKAARIARVFEAVGDWAGVIANLEEFEQELDAQTRALLERGRRELHKNSQE